MIKRIGLISVLLLGICLTVYEKQSNGASDGKQKPVATINGEAINEEDLEFYKVINRIQIAMNREAVEKQLQGKELEESMKFWDRQEAAAKDRNTLMTQIIRLHAVALLAKEKGYMASEPEVSTELEAVKKIYGEHPAASKAIQEYGEKQFWNKEHSQYRLIVLSKKVQQDVINKVKEANPKAEDKEINMLASKKYEELLVSQIGTLKIKIGRSS